MVTKSSDKKVLSWARSPVGEEIRRGIVGGKSWSDIAAVLNETGARTRAGAPWQSRNVARVWQILAQDQDQGKKKQQPGKRRQGQKKTSRNGVHGKGANGANGVKAANVANGASWTKGPVKVSENTVHEELRLLHEDQGHSIREVATLFNRRGWRTVMGKKFTMANLNRIYQVYVKGGGSTARRATPARAARATVGSALGTIDMSVVDSMTVNLVRSLTHDFVRALGDLLCERLQD